VPIGEALRLWTDLAGVRGGLAGAKFLHIAPPSFVIMEWATLMARLGSEEAQKFCRGR
jgi:hypothetical protein